MEFYKGFLFLVIINLFNISNAAQNDEAYQKYLHVYSDAQIHFQNKEFEASTGLIKDISKIIVSYIQPITYEQWQKNNIELKSAFGDKFWPKAKKLIESGDLDPNLHICGEPILFLAIADKQYEIIKLLIMQGADITIKNDQQLKRTVLMFAISLYMRDLMEIQMIEFLINWGADINTCDYLTGNSSLMYAADYGKKDLVELLLKQPNININEKNKEGRTALKLAVDSFHYEIVELLKKVGAV